MGLIKEIIKWLFSILRKKTTWDTIIKTMEITKIIDGAGIQIKKITVPSHGDIGHIAKVIGPRIAAADKSSRDKIIKQVNADFNKLEGISIGYNLTTGITVGWGGLSAVYNPNDGSVRVGLSG